MSPYADERPRHVILKRLALWTAPLLLVVVCLLIFDALDASISRSEAYLDLLNGRVDEARHRWTALQDTYWSSNDVPAGLRICDALEPGARVSRISPGIRAGLRQFPLRVLLHRALVHRHYEACLRLAGLAQEARVPFAPLYRAAALLELGRPDEARSVLCSTTEPFRDGPLGRRIARVLSALAEDARAILQDRRGTPIGWITTNEKIRFLDGIDTALLPVTTIQSAIAEDLAPSVRLSLDLELSQIAARALRGYRGSIVLLDPGTGEILAAVSDRRSRKRIVDPAFRELREPASIAKLITTTAALRAGLDVDREISKTVCTGAERFEGDFLYCPFPAGRLKGLNQAMAISCNIAFANLGVEVGAPGLIRELYLFGFGRPGKCGIRFGRLLHRSFRERALADLSIGLEETEITPLHAALIAAVFAGDGRMPEPTLFSARDGLLGVSSPYPAAPALGHPIVQQEWLPIVRNAMRAVVEWGGTVHGVEPGDFKVAMKTGTASAPGLGYHTNYIGFGPISAPTVAFCVRITGQRTSKSVRQASMNVTYRLLHYLAKHRDLLGKLPEEPRQNWMSLIGLTDQDAGDETS
ncbi:MAG: penicillin-binding transpeptidase domain-containing protein [Acidobacteriota bacterium]